MLQSFLRVAGILAAVYVAVCALAWRYQDRLAFPSPRVRLPDPSEFNIPDAERISVTTSDGVVLRGWYLAPAPRLPEGQRAAGLVWFYGNMEALAYIGPILRYLRPPHMGVVALDYRGYGESGSAATEAGIYRDAEAAWQYLTQRPEIDPARIAVYGRSVGSVPALYLATSQPVRAVVLDSPLTSAREMASLHYGFLPGFLIHLSLDNRERAARLSAPLLVFHGTKDQIAPVAMGEEIARAGKGELVRIEGAGHNDTYDQGDERYQQKMWAFLTEATR